MKVRPYGYVGISWRFPVVRAPKGSGPGRRWLRAKSGDIRGGGSGRPRRFLVSAIASDDAP